MSAPTLFAAWFLASIVVGFTMARFISVGQSGDLSRYLVNPKDDDR
jgi:hypothetical protein